MSRKLLLADDSVTIQKVIGISFVNEDFKLSVVDNGDAAFDKARAERPDLILADVFMPGKNGYELCAAVKADPALSRVPVLLLTGTFEPFDEVKAKACGADGWIAKPFESQTLVNRVKELLHRAESMPAPVAVVAPVSPLPEGPLAAPAVPIAPVAPAAPAADMWTELAEEEPVAPSKAVAVAGEAPPDTDFSGIFGDVEGAPPVAAAPDDIWGAVSFADEDLGPTPPEPGEVITEDIWGELDAPSAAVEAIPLEFISEPLASETSAAVDEFADFDEGVATETPVATRGSDEALLVFAEEPSVSAAEAVDEDEVMELDEEDILLLDDVEIIADEAALSEPRAEPLAGPEPAKEDDFVFVAEEEVAGAMEAVEDIPPIVEDIFVFSDTPVATEEAVTSAESAEAPMSAPEVFVTEPVAVAEDMAIPELEPVAAEIPEPEPITAAVPEPEPVEVVAEAISEPAPVAVMEEVPPTPVAVAAAVETRVRSLSEAELAAIVEKVAGAVIERLAGSILEKIAWEVVPDLAESLIKEELRQIKAEVGQPG